jgi:hypothetical protein
MAQRVKQVQRVHQEVLVQRDQLDQQEVQVRLGRRDWMAPPELQA